jgi:hypothetical protein
MGSMDRSCLCRRWLTGLAVALTLTAAPAHARGQQRQAPASKGEVGARLRQVRDHFGPAVSARIDDVLARARKSGVPEDLLVTKALEGAAKGVPGDRVVVALRDYEKRLERARGLLGGSPASPVLVAAADALQKGVEPGAVRSVGRAAGGDPLPLVLLGDLLDAGVPVGQAVEVVQTALRKGRRGDQLMEVGAQVRRFIRQGHAPGVAAQEVGRAIQGGQIPPMGGRGKRPGGLTDRGVGGGGLPSGPLVTGRAGSGGG